MYNTGYTVSSWVFQLGHGEPELDVSYTQVSLSVKCNGLEFLNISLCVRIVLFVLLAAAQCVETNPGPSNRSHSGGSRSRG